MRPPPIRGENPNDAKVEKNFEKTKTPTHVWYPCKSGNIYPGYIAPLALSGSFHGVLQITCSEQFWLAQISQLRDYIQV